MIRGGGGGSGGGNDGERVGEGKREGYGLRIKRADLIECLLKKALESVGGEVKWGQESRSC